ncbi:MULTISPECIES: STAS domain-containing protein [Streptomyces]|uniref:STAS domain-containing protein n=1 Tax=Streptomyces TaxID=1883 RepID=UPI0007CD7E41|nr:anti-anti-sigma factor [Streptomyces noursei]
MTDSGHASDGTGVQQYAWRDAWVIAARGDYDLYSITPLADALADAIEKHTKVVLDASGITFADSTLLNLLILTHQAGPLRVAAPSNQVQRLLKITGVDAYLHVRDTVDDAALA